MKLISDQGGLTDIVWQNLPEDNSQRYSDSLSELSPNQDTRIQAVLVATIIAFHDDSTWRRS